jgi:hypothetical protein
MRVITQAANQHLLIILGSGARPREKLGLENLQTNWLIRSGNGSTANSRVDCPQLSGVALPRLHPKTM